MNTIANTIVAQLGTTVGRMSAMLGTKAPMALESGLQFDYRGSRKSNKCRIVLEADDTYTVEFWRTVDVVKAILAGRDIEPKLVRSFSGVYADSLRSLFESQTGLYLSL